MMISFASLMQQGTAHAWLFIPSAIVLGILHGLEPGHSKTMMAAFIVAIRGTVKQAVLLGVTATISHTVIVWAIALGGMYLWHGLNADHIEPYFQFASGLIIICIALWMCWLTWRDHHQTTHHHHHHDDETRQIDTGHGVVTLSIFEEGMPPHWRIYSAGSAWHAIDMQVETRREEGTKQCFSFVKKNDYFESTTEIPEPHQFDVALRLTHGHHAHEYDLQFSEHTHHHDGLEDDGDAHTRAHAAEIRKKLNKGEVTNWQIALFGLTGGLIPCPAAITVLLLCLQLKAFSLGAVLVLCFSIGLAITLVTVGVVAAVSIKRMNEGHSWLSTIAKHAPYLSGALMMVVGIYAAVYGWYEIQSLTV